MSPPLLLLPPPPRMLPATRRVPSLLPRLNVPVPCTRRPECAPARAAAALQNKFSPNRILTLTTPTLKVVIKQRMPFKPADVRRRCRAGCPQGLDWITAAHLAC